MTTRVFPDASPCRRLAGGLGFTEGPVWLPAQRRLLFTDIPYNRVLSWNEDEGLRVARSNAHFAIGLTIDTTGRIIACEQSTRRVVRYADLAGGAPDTPIATAYQGRVLNAPNDVVVRADGTVFFTDPPYGVRLDGDGIAFYQVGMEQPACHVFRVTDDPAEPAVVTAAIPRPNGLCFAPDGRRLYVTDTSDDGRRIHVLELDGADRATRMDVFAVLDSGVPDGIRVDVAGNLYACGPDGVYVYEPGGRLLGLIPVPEMVANCTFGGDDGRTLFITATSGLYATRTALPGAK